MLLCQILKVCASLQTCLYMGKHLPSVFVFLNLENKCHGDVLDEQFTKNVCVTVSRSVRAALFWSPHRMLSSASACQTGDYKTVFIPSTVPSAVCFQSCCFSDDNAEC